MFLQARVDDQSVWFEYDQSDLSSHQECSYTEMDNPDKNGKEDQEILSIEDDACTFVSLQVMQKMVDERASCKYCGGSLSIIEDNDSCNHYVPCGILNALTICVNLTIYRDIIWLLK